MQQVTPGARNASVAQTALLTLATASVNSGIALAVLNLSSAHPDGKFILYDSNTFLNKISSEPSAYNITSLSNCMVSDPPFSIGGDDNATLVSICNNPNRFFFWDGIHPTTKGHELIAKSVAAVMAKHALVPYGWT